MFVCSVEAVDNIEEISGGSVTDGVDMRGWELASCRNSHSCRASPKCLESRLGLEAFGLHVFGMLLDTI